MATATAIQEGSSLFRDPRDLRPHPDNPRGEIDEGSPEITSLAEDIARRGIIQPIVIMPNGTILAGHRRQRAAIRAGLELVPVVVRELASHEFAEEIFLSENMQREDLTPLEEAKSIAAVHRKFEKAWKKPVPVADLARRIDIPKHTVTARLAILKLPERVQQFFHIRELPMSSATQLCRLLEWPDEIEKFADRLVRRQITNASLDALITRRMHYLREHGEIPDPNPTESTTPKVKRALLGQLGGGPSFSRKSMVETVAKSIPASVSMFNVKMVLDATCCSCGMIGNEEVCQTCPLPRFISGLIGRSDRSPEGDDNARS